MHTHTHTLIHKHIHTRTHTHTYTHTHTHTHTHLYSSNSGTHKTVPPPGKASPPRYPCWSRRLLLHLHPCWAHPSLSSGVFAVPAGASLVRKGWSLLMVGVVCAYGPLAMIPAALVWCVVCVWCGGCVRVCVCMYVCVHVCVCMCMSVCMCG